MTIDELSDRIDLQTGPGSIETARRFADQLIAGWPEEGTPFDARLVLDQHPELHRYKSVVLDLAYEEFCAARQRLTARPGRFRSTPSAPCKSRWCG